MAEIKTYRRGDTTFLGANNLLISNPNVSNSELILRYINPKTNNISESTLIPNNPEDEEDKKALYAFWQALKSLMKKARPNDDLNPYKPMNSIGFRGKLREKGDPQQMTLPLKMSTINPVKIVLAYLHLA